MFKVFVSGLGVGLFLLSTVPVCAADASAEEMMRNEYRQNNEKINSIFQEKVQKISARLALPEEMRNLLISQADEVRRFDLGMLNSKMNLKIKQAKERDQLKEQLRQDAQNRVKWLMEDEERFQKNREKREKADEKVAREAVEKKPVAEEKKAIAEEKTASEEKKTVPEQSKTETEAKPFAEEKAADTEAKPFAEEKKADTEAKPSEVSQPQAQTVNVEENTVVEKTTLNDASLSATPAPPASEEEETSQTSAVVVQEESVEIKTDVMPQVEKNSRKNGSENKKSYQKRQSSRNNDYRDRKKYSKKYNGSDRVEK